MALITMLFSPVLTAFPANAQTKGQTSSSSNAITETLIPQNQSYPLGITMDSRGNVWFAEAQAQSIVEYLISNQTFHVFKLPTNTTQLTMIWFLFFDKNGHLWFADQNQPLLWEFNPSSEQFANYSTGNQLVRPFGLAYESSTNQVWFTSTYTNQIGSFLLSNSETATLQGLITVPSIGSVNSGPSGIAIGQSGNVYVSQSFTGSISEYDPATQRFTHVWQLPNGSQPVGIYPDASRNLIWFTDHGSSLFGYINETDNKVQEFATSLFHYTQSNGENIASITLPYWITESSSGIVWFNEHYSDKIARFDPTKGTLTEYQVPTLGAEPLRFYIDNSSSEIWFTEFTGNKIGVLQMNASNPTGTFMENSSATLSNGPLELVANASSTLFNSTSFGGTMTRIGDVSSNLSIVVTPQGTSSSKITIQRGASLLSGNYTLTICETHPSQRTLSVEQCSPVALTVLPEKTSLVSTVSSETTSQQVIGGTETYVVAALVVVLTATISVLIIRRWRF
ncbi:MAG: Vgb family protein [Nitrososphaerales archaeon]